MKNFSVYFEIYGHKIKVENVLAETESEAQMIIKNKIKFHKTVQVIEQDVTLERLKNMFGMK